MSLPSARSYAPVTLVEPGVAEVFVDPSAAHGFTGGHGEAYRCRLLDKYDKEVPNSKLELLGGSMDWSIFTASNVGGTAIVRNIGIDWLSNRIAITYYAQQGDDKIEDQLVVGVITSATKNKADNTINLIFSDKIILLLEDETTASVGFSAGTVVTTAVKSLILASVPGSKSAVTEFAGTLTTAVAWEAGTPKLTIINDLLAAINYQSLWVDGLGIYQVRPYVEPDARPVVWKYTGGGLETFDAEVDDDVDLLGIPNQVVAISTTDGETEALVSYAVNADPTSPYSTVSRGRTISRTETDVEAVSQAVLDGIAKQLLISSSQVTWRQELQHIRNTAKLNDAVIGPSGQKATIVEAKQTLVAGALTTTTIRRQDTLFSSK